MTETLQLRRVLGIWVFVFGICAATAMGCARAQAKTVPDGPPLEVPAPPARVIAAAEEPIATAPAEPLEPAPALRAHGSAEKPIRDLVANAQRDLARVEYAKLPEAGKTQYEQSNRFAEQAEQALKDQNLTFAQTLADKAATLAAELFGR